MNEATATIGCPDAVLICARCEAKVHRLHMTPDGGICDDCEQASS